MDVTRSYQWLVLRGRVGISPALDDAEVELEIDPEGSGFCALDLQDAAEVADILAGFGAALWSRFQANVGMHGVARSWTVDEDTGVVTWPTPAGPLELAQNEQRNAIRMGGASTMRVRIRVNFLVELVQWLRVFAENTVQ